jgi:hypothetical protein
MTWIKVEVVSAIDRIAVEDEADDAEHAPTAIAVQRARDFHQLHVHAEIGRSLEAGAGALKPILDPDLAGESLHLSLRFGSLILPVQDTGKGYDTILSLDADSKSRNLPASASLLMWINACQPDRWQTRKPLKIVSI